MNRAILTLFLLFSVAAVAVAEGQPQASIESSVIDLGVVAKGDKVTQAFVIRNEGDAVLEITQVRPTCGCTVTEYDESIAPGETGEIRAVLDTTNFTGPISKTIKVTTNDAATPQMELALKADVRPYVSATPGYARYISYQGADPGVIVQTLWASDFPEEFEVLKVDTPFAHVVPSFREATEAERSSEGTGRQWVVETTLLSDSPIGALASHIVVHTNHPKQKLVKIPLSGFVRPMLFVSPKEANFGEIQLDEPRMLGLDVRNFAEEVIELTEVVDLPEGMQAEVKEIGTDRHRFQVILTATPEMAKGAFDGTLKIKTSSEKSPLIEVPLRGKIL